MINFDINKYVAIIVVNIAIFLILILLADWFFLAKVNYKIKLSYNENWNLTHRTENNLKFDRTKQPIILMGCSYTFGFLLNDKQTISYQLQKYSKRQIYNLGRNGGSVQTVLWQLENLNFFNDKLNPEYIIYIFMTDHLRRMYANYSFLLENNKSLQTYKYSRKKLIPLKQNINFLDYIKVSYFAKKLNNFIFMFKSDNQKFNLLKIYLKEIKKKIIEKYPNAKFVVIVYKDIPNATIKPFHTNRWSELEHEGIKVINLDTNEYNFLKQKEYLAIDGIHPSSKAWERLIPIISKELKL